MLQTTCLQFVVATWTEWACYTRHENYTDLHSNTVVSLATRWARRLYIDLILHQITFQPLARPKRPAGTNLTHAITLLLSLELPVPQAHLPAYPAISSPGAPCQSSCCEVRDEHEGYRSCSLGLPRRLSQISTDQQVQS